MSDDRIWVIEESTYIVRSNVPYVILFSRNYDDPTVTMRHEFKYTPYFYVPYGDAYNVTSSLIKQIDDTKYIDALGREVQRVYTHIPSDVPKAKLLFKWSDESDVLFDKRFLIDHHIKYAYKIVNDIPEPVELDAPLPPRRLYLDCEVIAPEGIIPLPQDAIYPIIMIQCRDSLTDKTVIFTTTIPETGDPTQFCCKNEQELLKTFALYVKELDPDVLVFWNGSKFDIPYIINRASILGISVSNLARNGQVKTSYDNGKFNNKIGGRSILDMLEAFKKFTSGMANRESYSLKNVIADKELLNKYDKDGNLITAYAFEYLDMGPMLQAAVDDKRYQELIDYGKNDVIALYNIDMSLGLYTFYENLKMVSGAKLDDMLYNSRIIEMLIWHEGIKPMPEKQHFVDDSDKFQGAHVVEPKPGVHSMMGTYDLASLYPNILCAMQLSPDIDKIVLRTLEKTMAMREELRARCKADPSNEVLQNMQNAIKFLNNSYYGVMGLKSFRLYDRHIAETVTRTGRELNMFLQECAKSQGKDVIFGDSVCKDTTLKIYDNVGNWKYVKISELFTHVDFTKGDKEYCNLNCYVESIDANGKIILDHVPYIMRHKCNKQMYNLSITNEWSINVTEDHSVFCYVSKKVKPKLEQYKRLIEKSPTEIGKNDINSIITRRSSIHTNVSSLNKDTIFYEYLGYHIGNGSIHYGKNGNRSGYRLSISFGKDEDILKSYFLDYLETNKYIYNITKDNRNNGDYRFYGELTHFIEINIGHAHEKHIPEFMYHETVENIQAFIRGYMTADGTVMVRNGLPIIRLTSISYDLIQGMQKLLFQVGIACGYFSENNENTCNRKSSGTYSKHLVIYDVMRYRNTIGFITPRKQERLSKCNPFKVDDSIDWSYSNKVIISPIDYNDYVYDLHCEQTNRYFANNILVHNTDSIGAIPIETVEEGKRLETYLNNELAKWSRNHNCKVTFTLKFEKLYRRILFKSDIAGKGVKKKYCGHLIWEEGRDKDELNYKGLELKRSDQSNITRDVLHYFLETILIHDNQSSAVSYVRKKYKEVLSGNVDIYEISIPKALRKIRYDTKNPYISGILNAKNNYNYIITEGAKPRLIYLIGDETICIDEDFDTSKISGCIDWKKMAEVTIKKKMESYIWSIGLNWEAVINGQNTLDAWF